MYYVRISKYYVKISVSHAARTVATPRFAGKGYGLRPNGWADDDADYRFFLSTI